jgi:nucleoside-diphosphate-sugar epimerase
MTTRRILVTGSSGFIAPYLIKALSANDIAIEVIGLYRDKNNYEPVVLENVQYRQCDLSDDNAVNKLFMEFIFDVVIHVAAALGPLNDSSFSKVATRDNIQAHANLISAAKNARCQRFIYCSTISVYTHPPSGKDGYRENDLVRPNTIYGWSKYAAEELLRIETELSKTMQGVSLRIAGAHGYGRNSGVIYSMLHNSIYGKKIILNEPSSCFRFSFIEDIVDAVLLVTERALPKQYCCYNVAGGDSLTLLEWSNKVLISVGTKGDIIINDSEKQRNEVMDISHFQEEMGFRPRPLMEKLNNYTDFLKQEYSAHME